MISEKEAIYIVGSYMLIKEIDAQYVFKWFMEMSVDSHEWLVFYRVYALIYKKSLMNRLLKSSEKLNSMFGFDLKFEWPKIWDDATHHFMRKHKNQMIKKVKA
jgi:deoxyribodipyrimidine photolyase-related protein